jgi:hypothetical protein
MVRAASGARQAERPELAAPQAIKSPGASPACTGPGPGPPHIPWRNVSAPGSSGRAAAPPAKVPTGRDPSGPACPLT